MVNGADTEAPLDTLSDSELDRLLKDAQDGSFALLRMLYDPAKQLEIMDKMVSGCLSAFDQYSSAGHEDEVLSAIPLRG